MNLNVAICDDDPEMCDKLKTIIEKYQITFDHNFQIDIFSDGISLCESPHLPDYNILFLDVEMPILSGLEAAMHIRNSLAPAAKIIFVSNYPEYMQSSFSVHPYHYLKKPVSDDMIYSVLSSAIKDIERDRFFIELSLPDLSEMTLKIHDLLYIESIDSRKRILSVHSKTDIIEAKGTLADCESDLEGTSFVRCHKSILVNLFHIHYLHKQEIILDTNETIPVGRSYATDIRNKLSKMLFQLK